MKKLGLTFLTALVGGLIAVGGYKLFEHKQESKMSFEERQQLHYASNPVPNVVSSTGNPDFTQAAAMVAPAVVHITTTYPGRQRGSGGGEDPMDLFEEFFGMPRQRQQRSQPPAQATGSGVIISEDGYIVTNNHVVEDANKIEVQLTDKRVVEAKIIGRDPNTDLALIKISEKGLPFVRFGDSDDVRIGEWVLAVGYPLGLESTVTAGIVSATGRSTGIIARELQQRQYQQRGYPQSSEEPLLNTAVESFIQTDAVINKGNSGGPLVNANGELIGINSNIMTPTGTYAGYGFAVPVNLVKKIADDFIKFGMVKRGLIGISFTELNPATAKELEISDVNGLYVNDVVPSGAAEDAGLKKGDIITKLDGRVIASSSDLQERVYRLRPGDKVRLTYKRDNKEREVTVTLKEDTRATESAKEESEAKRSATEIYNKLGAGFVPATDAKKKELGISSGVVVTQVHQGGLFDYFNVQRGLVITHINGKPVNSADDVEAALADSQRGIVRIVGVPQRGSRVELNVPIEY
ncbi:Do family serine endopeptidase [Parapedobacter koreensis]|uniref:Do/DeqQ family serine protease n=1 Tax=Parapedobacter koreensis TaxID=332977 RepID=A0A1H7RHH0_9SPHI|nr:Do family serine endopeptidase [Parapedobacter koreensis]SEL59676.1 Do/DeqQ family serine protease [Parapedobacter koreensis]